MYELIMGLEYLISEITIIRREMKRPINQDNYPKSNVSTLDQTETQFPVRYVCSAFQYFLI